MTTVWLNDAAREWDPEGEVTELVRWELEDVGLTLVDAPDEMGQPVVPCSAIHKLLTRHRRLAHRLARLSQADTSDPHRELVRRAAADTKLGVATALACAAGVGPTYSHDLLHYNTLAAPAGYHVVPFAVAMAVPMDATNVPPVVLEPIIGRALDDKGWILLRIDTHSNPDVLFPPDTGHSDACQGCLDGTTHDEEVRP